MATGLVFDERFLLHETRDLPEVAGRLRAVMGCLEGTGLLGKLVRVEARPAGMGAVKRVHTETYLKRFKAAVDELPGDGGAVAGLDNDDVVIGAHSWEGAFLAAGGVLAMCDAVMGGKVANGFCATRPPGHHAERHMAMGFCLLNNVAIAARHLQTRHGLKKVAIVDWDVHHGNGTQHIFEEDPTVLFISLHEDPRVQYPGTGFAAERGRGAGLGFTLNLPMMPGTENGEYQAVFTRKVLPALRKFAPEALLISAGFDAHFADPLGHLNLTADCFAWMTRRLKAVAKKQCKGRLISVLEGGYNFGALGECVGAHVGAMME